MATPAALHANIVGIPHIPSITEVNVRTGPALNRKLVFRIPVGTRNLLVSEVTEDAESRQLNGKTFHWFRLMFPDGRTGWVRDDLISLIGDGTSFGYLNILQETLAFNLQRSLGTDEPVAEEKLDEKHEQDGVGEAMTPEDVRRTEEHRVVEVPPTDELRAAFAMCRMPGGVNMRSGPGTNHAVIGRFLHLDEGEILQADFSQSGEPLHWVRLRYQSREDSWVRIDFLRLRGGFGRFGFAGEDLYPSPAPQSNWSRDFDPTGSYLNVPHDGWDKSGSIGAPILSGPKGGLVVQTALCQFCGPQGFSVEQKGIQVGSSQVFVPGWNFGYGHFVIVRYTNDLLPESTRNQLAQIGREGEHLFVMHAHLHNIMVTNGQVLRPNQQIGTMGNSGNSTGAHLHLEVRASESATFSNWAAIRSGLLSPGILFLR